MRDLIKFRDQVLRTQGFHGWQLQLARDEDMEHYILFDARVHGRAVAGKVLGSALAAGLSPVPRADERWHIYCSDDET